jgi:uncharacterized membrane protein HdeD (DUF308 family)
MAKTKKKNNSGLWTALLYILIGLTLVIFRTQALGWAMTIIGAFFIVFGALDLLGGNMVGGAISLIIGIAIIVLGWTLMKIVLLVLGILIALKGLLALNDELKKKKHSLLGLLFPILSIVFGILLAFGNGFSIIIVLVGIFFVVDGLLGLVAALK